MVLAKTEATQAIIFSEEENISEPYLSGQILDSKHKVDILYWAGTKYIMVYGIKFRIHFDYTNIITQWLQCFKCKQ